MEKVYFVGMDQHKETSTVHVRGSDGSPLRTMTIQHDRLDPLRRLMGELTQSAKVHVGLEATGFYWWMVKELRRLGAVVHLGHPSAMRLIFKSKNKTDKNDAERLSKLLWIGEFPESYVPTEEEAQLRESVGTRQLLVKMRTQFCNRIRQLFAKHNEPMPNRGQLFSGPSLEALRGCGLPGEWGTSLQMLVEGMDSVHEQVRASEERLQEQVKANALCEWIDGVHGFGTISAATLGARVAKFERYPNRRTIGSYFGLAPRVANSAETERLGHIDKMGPGDARHVLVQAVHCIVRTRPEAAKYFSYLCRHTAPSKAYVAMARRLLVGLRAAKIKGEAFELGKCFRVPQTRTFAGRHGAVDVIPVKRRETSPPSAGPSRPNRVPPLDGSVHSVGGKKKT